MSTYLRGRMRCLSCRATWEGTWSSRFSALVCHACGGPCLPEGLQLLSADVPCDDAPDAVMWELEAKAVVRTMS